ncbi:LD-carboxypeptidase [Amnibacterium sp. CER49]|uniref:S66 family peptidase n=1 Tax=Amnibacterium sp. CER49 TaxID=3039161 RepID=UPI00244BA141|nr:LD-carboxypeptidase [Amnibacterium sp. CER49]MDH2444277.1 LD-carboxypeptidase [Amnibacterium sp. CER49]
MSAETPVRYPRPLQPGDRIGVTSPSSGVGTRHLARLEASVLLLTDLGYDVRVGRCMDGASHVSAPAADRAAELQELLLDPEVRAVVPPWGGETAIDLVPLLDWAALAEAEPTWLVGYSDLSTLLVPLTLLTGTATLHGSNLMDTPYSVPPPLLHWLDVATGRAGERFRQASAGVSRRGEWDDWTAEPAIRERRWNGDGGWVRLDSGTEPVDVQGRLIGGCIETLGPLAGTPFADVRRLPGPRIVYVEAAEDPAFAVCRALHGMRLAGFFDDAVAVLVGRTDAPDAPTMTQHEAVRDALLPLGVPIIGEVDCGHVPPQAALVNGALAHLVFSDERAFVEQSLV